MRPSLLLLLWACRPPLPDTASPGDTQPPGDTDCDADADTDTDADSDADADSDSDADADTDTDSDADTAAPPLTYPDQRVGIFYLTWHAYAAQAMASLDPSERHVVEQAIQDTALSPSALLLNPGLYNTAVAFHYHSEPQPGFYCLYRARDGEEGVLDDCADIPETAALHAQQLWDAGVDFVYVDLTNLPSYSDFADALGLRPLEVLLEEWAALRAAGNATPQVAAWVPATADAEDPLFAHVLEVYAQPDYAGLILEHAPSGQQVMFIVDHGSLPASDAHLATIAAAGVLPVKLWGNLGADTLASGTAGWMQPCTAADGSFTTLLGPDTACAQGYTSSSPLGTVLSVSASFQVGYASLPFQASGRLEGLTLKKQMERAYALQPDYLLLNAWNEHIAQPQANPYSESLGDLRRSMGMGGLADDDAAADWLWVDMYGASLSRDMEPTVQDGGAAYVLMQSCLRVYRAAGSAGCAYEEVQGEACCDLGNGPVLVHSLRHAGDTTGTEADHVPTTSAVEKDALLAAGWEQVCNPHYGPLGLCGGGTTGDGPFLLFADSGAERVALYRCYTGVDHFISPDVGCEGTTGEGLLGYASSRQTSETPRPLRRCYNSAATAHLHWLDGDCPATVSAEALLGYVR